MPCPEPDEEQKKQEHIRLVKESCYFSDIGCGHAYGFGTCRPCRERLGEYNSFVRPSLRVHIGRKSK